jgi:bifunctional non-homologous end joining protein LigD
MAAPDRRPPSQRQYVPTPMPGLVEFMHPRLVGEPPSSDLWLHEVKFDGYRVQIRVQGGEVTIFTRNGHDWRDTRWPGLVEIEAEASALPDCILDGELCPREESGQSDFSRLKRSLTPVRTRDLTVMVFDVLWRGQEDLRPFSLTTRKAVLATLIEPLPGKYLRLIPALDTGGKALLQAACQMGLEGIVSKRRRSTYEPGRSTLWLKSKCRPGQEVVIGGWVQEPGRSFKALLVGTYDAGRLLYAGSVKTGFAGSSDLLRRLEALETPASPFTDGPPRKAENHWVRPELVANVEIAEWTGSGKLRQASFKGLREDKDPVTVRREQPIS